jgi:spore coat protein H
MVGSRIACVMRAGLIGYAFGCGGDAGPPERVDESKLASRTAPVGDSDRVFDTSVLHEIRIEIAPEYLDSLANDREQRVPCTFIFDGQRLENVAIRQKGKGSQLSDMDDKPSFSVKFNDFVRGQKLHGLNKLILNNSDMDPTLLNEHLAYHLYDRAGIPSRRSAHAVVTLSGMDSGDRNYGVYVVVEAVNDKLMARHFGEQYEDGNLFEDEGAGDFADDPLAIDHKDADEPGRSRERLVEFAEFINGASDDELAERLDEFIDLQKALDSFALDLLLENVDGFWVSSHNYYLYEHPADRRFILLPHGMDLLFQPEGRPCGVVPEQENLSARLAKRISAHPELRARVEQSIDRMLDEVWDVELIVDRIDALTRLLERSDHDEPDFLEQREEHLEAREILIGHVRSVEAVWRAGESTCGDGVRSGIEQCASMCEDGNLDDGDGCSSACMVEYCGDGIVQPELGEVCEEEEEGCHKRCRLLCEDDEDDCEEDDEDDEDDREDDRDDDRDDEEERG